MEKDSPCYRFAARCIEIEGLVRKGPFACPLQILVRAYFAERGRHGVKTKPFNKNSYWFFTGRGGNRNGCYSVGFVAGRYAAQPSFTQDLYRHLPVAYEVRDGNEGVQS